MAGQTINVGGIQADLALDSTHLDRGLANARRAIDAAEAEIRQLQNEFNRGAITAAGMANRVNALNQTIHDLTVRMNAAYQGTTTLNTGLEIVNQRAGQMTASSGRMGMALMQLGAIVDDVQYGFQGVVNNIGPLVYGLSGNMSIAAGAQIAAVGVYQLYARWNQLMDALELSPVKSEAQQMEELGHKTHKTAEETALLNKHKKEQLEIERLLGTRPKAETEENKAVEEVITEADSKKVKKAILEHIQSSGHGAQINAQEEAELANVGTVKALPGLVKETVVGIAKETKDALMGEQTDINKVLRESPERQREAIKKKIQDRINQENNELANKIIGNPDKRETLKRIVRDNPGAFPEGFSEQLEDPATKTEKKTIDQEYNDATKELDDSNKKWAAYQKRKQKERDKFKRGPEQAMDSAVQQFRGSEALKKAQAEEKRKKEQHTKELVDKAKETIPGIEDMAQNSVLASQLKGMTGGKMHSTGDMLTKLLKDKGGMSDEDAREAATSLTKDAMTDTGKKVAHKLMNGDEGETKKVTSSETFGASELANKVQAGVNNGDKEAKKHTTLLEKVVEVLKEKSNKTVSFDIT